VDFLKENLSEKTTTSFELGDMPSIPDHELFIKIQDFEKSVLVIPFISLIVYLGVFLI